MWNMIASTGASITSNGGRGGSVASTGVKGGGSNGFSYAGSATVSMMQLQGGSPTSASTALGMSGSGVGGMHERSQEVCKYFVNGGCLRGAACPYLHELPDERHLDINGLGFILNPNVHNAQKTSANVSAPPPPLPPPGQAPLSAVSTQQIAQSPSPVTVISPLTVGLGAQSKTSRLYAGNKVMVGKNPTSHLSLASGVPSSLTPLTNIKLSAPPRYVPPDLFLEYNLPPALAIPLRLATEGMTQSLASTMLQK